MKRLTATAALWFLTLCGVAAGEHHTARFFTSFGSPNEFSAMAFSPKGDLLVFVPKGGPISIFDTASGEIAREIKFDPFAVCFAEDGRHFLARSTNGTKLIDARTGQVANVEWNVPQGQLGCELRQKSGKLIIDSVIADSPAAEAETIHSGDELIALVDRGSVIPLLGRSIAEAVKRMDGPVGTPITLRIIAKSNGKTTDVELRRKPASKSGGKLVFQRFRAGASPQAALTISEGQLIVLDANGGNVLSMLTPLTVTGAGPGAISPDGRRVVSASRLKEQTGGLQLGLEVFDVVKQERTHSAGIDAGRIHKVCFTPDNQRVLIGSFDRILVYDLEKKEFAPPILIGFDPGSARPKSGGGGSRNAALESAREELGIPTSTRIEASETLSASYDISPDGKFVAIGSGKGHCTLWSTERNEKLGEIGEPSKEKIGAEGIVISPDAKWVAYYVKGTLHLASLQDNLKAATAGKNTDEQ